MTGKVWFITGASRGFGRIWAEAALARGGQEWEPVSSAAQGESSRRDISL